MLPDNWLSEGRLPIQLCNLRTNIGDEYIQCTKAAKPADLWPPVLMSNAAVPHRWGVEPGRNNNPSLHFSLFLLPPERQNIHFPAHHCQYGRSLSAQQFHSLSDFSKLVVFFLAVRYKETFRPSTVCPRLGDTWLRDANGDNAMLAKPLAQLCKNKGSRCEYSWRRCEHAWADGNSQACYLL